MKRNVSCRVRLVREAGLEPARPDRTREPESSESANSTTRAHLFRKKGTFVLPLPKENEGSWLREEDLNLRPPGYEPDELPTALPRDILVPVTGLEPVRYLYQGILSPARLPISPHRQITSKM